MTKELYEKSLIVTIKPQEFFYVLKNIEKRNLENPSEKILIMRTDKINPQSPQSGLLLKNYYHMLQKTPQMGFSLLEFKSLINNHKNNDQKIECCYCHRVFKEEDITIDHFKPRALKGLNQFHNIRLACASCNVMKGCIYPQKMPESFKIFQDKASHHEFVSSLTILKEASQKPNLCNSEKQLLNKIIRMELNWRTVKGYSNLEKPAINENKTDKNELVTYFKKPITCIKIDINNHWFYRFMNFVFLSIFQL
jgi:5-methylcytosine-specific restriction endonuclease McrA